ncbi:NGG1p interacting factor 3 [Dentipellis sp. KUC8613]|nr:NGG1p interacting factor 3 [Dentipellis sp. KUC8613]
MSVARYISRVMERIAPLSLAEKWDNVGLLLESPHQPQRTTHHVLLTIDLTTKVVNEALALPATAIIAYHPVIFKPISSLTLTSPLQASLLRCAAAGISVYTPHTALDSIHGGINDWLAEGLGKGQVSVLEEKEGGLGGAGRVLRLDEKIDLSVLQQRVKKHLGLSHIQVARSASSTGDETAVQTIAICAGSGGSMLLGVDADVYFTGEMSHHEVLAAIASGRNVILTGHTNTERGYLPVLAKKLQQEFASAEGSDKTLAEQLTVHVSKADRHPLEIV